MYLECSFENDIFVLKAEALTTHFQVLKPQLKENILNLLEDCEGEGQVNISIACLTSMGAIEII